MPSAALRLIDSLLLDLSSSQLQNKMTQSTDNQLKQLSGMTLIVADTGEISQIKKFKPTDATTNPSLVLKALNSLKKANENEYKEIINKTIKYAKSKSNNKSEQLSYALDRITVEFGLRILPIIKGYVSTELDARLSFDVEASVKRAQRIISIYEELGIKDAKNRILIKIASTYEGIQACKRLHEFNVNCNMTLLFNIWQAAAAAKIGNAYLISPFVGRITDWHKKNQGVDGFDIKNDPGPKNVLEIYRYYKTFGFKTIVMGASFRNKQQILALAGCDRLTIGPKFLEELSNSDDQITKVLDPNQKSNYKEQLNVTESNFRYGMCRDAMANDKLAEGIRRFADDIVKLENILKQFL